MVGAPVDEEPASARLGGDRPQARGCGARLVRSALRGVLVIAAASALYCGVAEALSWMPGGGRATTAEGPYLVHVTSNGVHVDLVLPVRTDVVDWSTWIPPVVPLASRSHASFGWGDRGFYTRVPTWSDLTPGIALRGSLLPTPAAMRVVARNRPPLDRIGVDVFRIGMEREEYVALVEYVRRSFRTDEDGRPVRIDHPGYTERDRFFEGEGSYHLFRTCNEWVSDGLRAAGIAAPAWTPLERNVVTALRRAAAAER